MDPDDLNFDGVAIEEILNNEDVYVVQDGDYMVDNPGDNNWKVDPNSDPLIKPPGGFFNVLNLNTNEEFLQICRNLNKVQLSIFLHTLHCFKTTKQLPMFLYIGGSAGEVKAR